MTKIKYFYTIVFVAFLSLSMNGMNLFVQTPNNGTISLDVEPSDSGENVKAKIFDQISVPVINQVLTWNGTTIQDNQTLADVGIVTNNSSIVLTVTTTTQVPEKMSYQAVVRNTTNNLVTNQPVGMQISILQGSSTGTAVYVETQTPTSNANGLVSLEIGGGTVVSGNMATINWANGPYFIKTETDPTGGSSYTITGTSQLLSAPYALYAKTSGSSTPGPQGPAGATGSSGTNGLDGATGPMGPQGTQGLTGPTGATGANGTNGLVGATGPMGPQGLTGPQGAAGTNGQGVPTGGTTGQVLAKVDGTDYTTQWITPSSGTTLPTQTGNEGKVLTTDGSNLSWGTPNATPSQLEVFTTASGAKAYRIFERDTTNYGVLGNDAVDLSYSDQLGSTNGATGNGTFTAGYNNKASADGAVALGVFNNASGVTSTALGVSNVASGQAATVSGFLSKATGGASTAMGFSVNAIGNGSVALGAYLNARSGGEVVVGTGNTDYTPADSLAFNSADRAFVVGIGEVALGSVTSQKDGLIVYKDGTLAFDKLSTAPAITQDRLYALNDKLHYNGTEIGQDLPTGGTTGQVLAKVDGTDYNTQWVTPANTGWNLTGNAGTVPNLNFIGTTDNVRLDFRTNNTLRWYITQNGRFLNNSALGSSSIFIGGGNETTTGTFNTSLGTNSLSLNTSGGSNTAIGVNSLMSNTTGGSNVSLGASLRDNTTGSGNTSAGNNALINSISGNSNSAFGLSALLNNTTGSNNTAVGATANVSANNLTNATAIGYGAIVNASNKIRLGNENVTATDIAGQVKVNAHSTANDFTLPANRGTANQVLSTDGAGATQWVTPSTGGSGAQVALIATKTTNAQVLSLANETNTGDLVTFDNVVTSNTTFGSYNTATNTFTVNQAGVYCIQATVRTPDAPNPSLTPNQFLFVDFDNAGITGINTMFTDYPIANPGNFPSGVKGKGFTSVMMYLTAGQTINIKGLTANSNTLSQGLSTNGTCKFMIFKL